MLIKDKAKLDAENLRAELGLGVPTDPFRVAAMLGIIALRLDLDNDTSGMLFGDEDGTTTILVDRAENERRQNFTCAHEIGHFIERSNRVTPTSREQYAYVDRRGAKRDAFEFYADEFASNLLMPEDDVREQWAIGQRTTAALAHRYKVTPLAVNVRLTKLGLR